MKDKIKKSILGGLIFLSTIIGLYTVNVNAAIHCRPPECQGDPDPNYKEIILVNQCMNISLFVILIIIILIILYYFKKRKGNKLNIIKNTIKILVIFIILFNLNLYFVFSAILGDVDFLLGDGFYLKYSSYLWYVDRFILILDLLTILYILVIIFNLLIKRFQKTFIFLQKL